ncbi:hypothetical protein AALO_G00047150 [Alosa alosa]|uniref:Uncharacterized protein n=1 Tax=Alosa alosa TaxID=278164 RepID=A0AAV6H2W2_9TELE|nr:hypothetical protein AALO_G00047150 [Alosa alosa]
MLIETDLNRTFCFHRLTSPHNEAVTSYLLRAMSACHEVIASACKTYYETVGYAGASAAGSETDSEVDYKATHHRHLQNGPNSDRIPPVTYCSEVVNSHFTVLQDFGLLVSF